MIDDDDDVSIL